VAFNDGIRDSILDTVNYSAFSSGPNFNQVNALIGSRDGPGVKWLQTTGPLTITYSFIGGNSAPRDTQEYASGLLPHFTGTVTAFTGSAADGTGQQGNIRAALEVWEKYANVDFVLVEETASSVGDMRFGMSTALYTTATAESAPPLPSNSAAADLAAFGDTWFRTSVYSSSTFAPDTKGFFMTLHEVGHTVFGFTDVSVIAGLGGQTLDASFDTTTGFDTSFWTLMSSSTVDAELQPRTPMYLDILAAHRLYGDVNIFTGDDTYTVDADSLMTIWDDGGSDTIVWNSNSGARISLTSYADGANVDPNSMLGWSGINDGSFDIADRRFFIAPGSQIENVTGGSGDDYLEGNNANNVINGGGGSDTVYVTYAYNVGYTVSGTAANLVMSGSAGDDTFEAVEFVHFSNGVTVSTSDLLAPDRMPINDFNGDGQSDLLWQHTSGTFSEWQSTGDNFTPNVVVGGVGPGWHSEGSFDFSGDGQADLLWRNDTTGQFTIWNSTGDGFAPNSFVGEVSNDWTIAALGDFNGDGKDDMIFRNTASGTFTEWQSTGTGFETNVFVAGINNSWHLVAAADFDGDGKDDLLWRNDNGTFTEWQSNGDGFDANVYVNSGVDPTWHVLTTGDFNGDGKDDLLFRNDNGTITEWRSTGDGFTANVLVIGGVSNDWQLAQTGDFNGDGKDDLIFRNDSGVFTEWQSTGDSFTPNVVVGSVASDWNIITHQYDVV